MKNVLLPTVFDCDTIAAFESAVAYADGENFTIVLLYLNEAASSYSASDFLRHSRTSLSQSQQKILEECRSIARKTANVDIHLQKQASISAPLLKNLVEALEIGLVIVPKSFRESSKKINRYCLGLLANSRCPILNLCEAPTSELQKALYLDYAGNTTPVSDLQQKLDGKFPFRIVSQARISREEEDSLRQMLAETITRNEIDLLVETRKPAKVRIGKRQNPIHETFKLPVLSVFEEIR